MRGGIDLGGTKIQAIVVAGEQGVVGEARHPTPRDDGPGGVVAAMAAALREAASHAGVEPPALAGVGVGSPGDVSPGTGTVANAGNLPDWRESFPLATRLSSELGTPVAVGNDVSVATNAEHALGAGRGYDSVLGVFWGTGVGGGLVLGGEPWHGRGAAGEIGHMVIKRDGAKCPCGNHGCLEAYAGRSAMEAEARHRLEDGDHTDLFKLMVKHDKPRLTSGIWERALDHEDRMAAELIDRAVKALGAGIASAVNLIDPEIVVLGGGLGVRLGERLGPEIRKRMERNLFNRDDPPAFEIASLGDLGGALGAALLVA
jgi:glucokinase